MPTGRCKANRIHPVQAVAAKHPHWACSLAAANCGLDAALFTAAASSAYSAASAAAAFSALAAFYTRSATCSAPAAADSAASVCGAACIVGGSAACVAAAACSSAAAGVPLLLAGTVGSTLRLPASWVYFRPAALNDLQQGRLLPMHYIDLNKWKLESLACPGWGRRSSRGILHLQSDSGRAAGQGSNGAVSRCA